MALFIFNYFSKGFKNHKINMKEFLDFLREISTNQINYLVFKMIAQGKETFSVKDLV